MIDPRNEALKRSRLREAALARWNNEGGAGPGGRPQAGSAAPEVHHLTIGAAGQMIDLRQGAAHFRTRRKTGA